MRLSCSALVLPLLLGVLACGSEDPTAQPDAGFADAVAYDSGPVDAAARPDANRVDVGPIDAGFSDPELIRGGVEDVSGLRTYLEIYGTTTSTNPPVIVLHRGPMTSSEYLPPFFKFLLPGRRLIFYDMRATGQTSYGDGTPTSTITFAQHVRDLDSLINFVGQLPEGIDTGTVDLVGHEYGAAVAFMYAADHPARVSKLVLLNPFPINIAHHSLYRQEVEARLTAPERELYYAIRNRPECFGSLSECAMQIWQIVGPHYMCPQNRDLFSELIFRYGSFRAEYFYVERELRNSRYDWQPRLADVEADTTIVSGPCEPIPVATSTTYAAGIPGARHVVLPLTGEFPMVEAPQAFEATVKSALRHP